MYKKNFENSHDKIIKMFLKNTSGIPKNLRKSQNWDEIAQKCRKIFQESQRILKNPNM